MKVAIVCDWLTNVGGAEKVLLAIHEMYPKAPIYTSQYNPKGIDWFADADVRTGWLQHVPAKLRRVIPMLRQRYFDKLDLSDYDLVISVTGAEAKSVKCGPNTTHICYCHVPTQYYWQMYDDYVKNPGFGALNPIVRTGFKAFVKPLKKADFSAAQRPDYFVTISTYAAEMIKKYYKRDAAVIAPPVEIGKFADAVKSVVKNTTSGGYINFSRQVSWKRQDLAIKACIKAGKNLSLIGEGPEHEALVKAAGDSPLIEFKKQMTTKELAKELHQAKAFIFPSMEPFGIAPVEALAAGCPVIAFREGGATDYIQDGKNGILFERQTANSIAQAIERFEQTKFDHKAVVKSAEEFDVKHFKRKLKEFIDEKMAK